MKLGYPRMDQVWGAHPALGGLGFLYPAPPSPRHQLNKQGGSNTPISLHHEGSSSRDTRTSNTGKVLPNLRISKIKLKGGIQSNGC